MHEAVGRTQSISCQLDPARAVAMQALLGIRAEPSSAGDTLPQFWHQIFFWNPAPPSELGRDSHVKLGDFIPDLGLPRRMWAGGKLIFHRDIRLGVMATKQTRIENVTRKSGRSGPLAFITLRHEIQQEGQLCLTEWQDLVFREDPDVGATPPAPPKARTDETMMEQVDFNTTLLFRYSALTFNGHRIHYDLDYCRNVEGYSGLVVHGVLLAQYLVALAESQVGKLSTFEFRATSPLMHFDTAEFCWNDGALWVRGPDGRLCMQASAS